MEVIIIFWLLSRLSTEACIKSNSSRSASLVCIESGSNCVTVLAADLRLATLVALEAEADWILVGRLDCLIMVEDSLGRSGILGSSRLSLLATLSVLESGLPRMSFRDISSLGFLSSSNFSTFACACLMMVSISKSLSS